MSIYDRLRDHASKVEVTPASTSYYSTPEDHLDPNLFVGDHLRPQIQQDLLSLLYGFWAHEFSNAMDWSTVWIAGSGVSYQWSAARDPGDLDILIGVDFVKFRQSNPENTGLSDHELASMMNSGLRLGLASRTKNWRGLWEVTWYINDEATDIRSINPYAAYNVSAGDWTVRPDPVAHAPQNASWDAVAAHDAARAHDIITRYGAAVDTLHGVNNPAHQLNSAVTVRTLAQEGASLFDEIHQGRHAAFEPGGLGYGDFTNFRWQAGKASGAIQALKRIKDDLGEAWDEEEHDLYGAKLPDAHDLLIASAVSHRYRS